MASGPSARNPATVMSAASQVSAVLLSRLQPVLGEDRVHVVLRLLDARVERDEPVMRREQRRGQDELLRQEVLILLELLEHLVAGGGRDRNVEPGLDHALEHRGGGRAGDPGDQRLRAAGLDALDLRRDGEVGRIEMLVGDHLIGAFSGSFRSTASARSASWPVTSVVLSTPILVRPFMR